MTALANARGVPDRAPVPRRLTHANFFVADWEKSMDFYMSVIGLDESYRRPPFKAGFVTNGSTHHDIAVMAFSPVYWKREPRTAGLFHVALELEHDLALCRWYDHAVARGLEFSMIEDHRNTHSLYMYDPDGNQVEVYVDTLKDWRRLKTGTIEWSNVKWQPWNPPPTTDTYYDEAPTYTRLERSLFHPLRTTHAVFVADDYPAMLRFYTEIIGLEPVLGGADAPFTSLRGTLGERSVSLFRRSADLAPGFHHVGLLCGDGDELARSVKRAREAGIAPVAVLDHPARLSVAVEDLDGNLVQLYAERGGAPVAWGDVDPHIALYLV